MAGGCERKGDQGIALHERELNAAQRRRKGKRAVTDS